MTAPLRIDRLTRRLGRRDVLAGLSLAVESGECVVLAGESGSGKTSLLRVVGGLDRADAGSVTIDGRTVEDAGRVFVPPEQRGLGMVFQDFALWPHLSVLENVALAVPRRRERRQRAKALLERLGVGACAPRLPATLSGGQQQRVGIARALAAEPRLLLLDEPLSSLDLETRETLRAELRGLIADSGLTALCVSHDPADCMHLGDQIAVLEAGRISQCGAPESLFAAPRSAYAARLAGLLGGITMRAEPAGTDAVLCFGGAPVRVPGMTLAGGAQLVRVFWPAGAILPSASQMGDGVRAECQQVRFDAGMYRATYRVAGLAGSLTVIAAERSEQGPARLAIDGARLRLVPVPPDADAHTRAGIQIGSTSGPLSGNRIGG